MAVMLPTRLAEALEMVADSPDAHVLAGGTDLMVEVNHGHRRPPAIVAIRRVPELRGWTEEPDGMLRIGAATTYTDLLHPDLAGRAPALAAAARTVGSPQIRNAGTIGGNLGTGSPAGDTLPVLVALDAEITLVSTRGERRMAVRDFLVGPKRTAREPGELISAVRIPAAQPGEAQEFLKVGTRNAMVIAVASCALILRPQRGEVRVALGSVGPVPLRAAAAEAWVADHWPDADPDTFSAMVAEAARPIDDHRSTAAYRRHAVGVLAARALDRARARAA
jgi:CO/xanthine dehydrogenase FAD-binding subunit